MTSKTFAVMYSSVTAFDGLDAPPIDCVEILGVADGDAAVFEMIAAHFDVANAEGDLEKAFADRSSMLVPNAEFEARRDASNQLWFTWVEGQTEIRAGYGEATLYRAIAT